MNEVTEDNKIEPPPLPPPLLTPNVIEDSIASRTKEITKRPKRERSPSKIIILLVIINCIHLFSSSNSTTCT